MRAFACLLLLAATAQGQERTWTIATAVVTTEAELMGVRGDVVYLKVGDKIESVPMARLSIADHQFISSLSLAPVRSGSNTDQLPAPSQGTQLNTFAPFESTPALTEESIPLPGGPVTTTTTVVTPSTGQGTRGTATRSGNGSRSTNARGSGGSTAYRGAGSQGRGPTTTTARRLVPPPSQMQNGQRGNSNNNDDNPGLLGIRNRRGGR